jgi:general secretion pathway protein D
MNRRAVVRDASGAVPAGSVLAGAVFGLLAFLAVVGMSPVALHAESAGSLFKHGQTAEAREDYDAAFDFYQKAYAKEPKDLRYRTAFYRVRVTASSAHVTKGRKLLASGDEQGALAEFLHAAEIDPGNESAQQEIARARQGQGEPAPAAETSLAQAPGSQSELNSMGAPVALKPLSNEPLTMHYTEDAKVIYQAIGKAAGINVLFDPDYTSKRIQVDLSNSSLLDALRIVGTMSNTFWRPVTTNTIFVIQNSRSKRTEQDEEAIQTFYLTNAWQQNDMNDIQTALRNVLAGTVKVYGVAGQNAIIVRGTPDELLLAQKLINDLDKARPEVVVDIAVMEVSKNWERTLGIAWPSSVGVALQSTTSSSSSSCTAGTTGCTSGSTTTPTLYDLAHLKATNFAVTVGSATMNLLLSDANTKLLQSPRIRATDSQKATMKIGSKIPIATGSYQTGAATAVVSSLVNTQFQYQDVGVNIEMTPTVHFDNDITLKIKIEVTSQSGSVTISGVTEPILSQRVVDQVIRLREGEANILGGIDDKQDQTSWTGIPGLSSIPILKYIFGSRDHTIQDDDIVFVVVPHVVRSETLDPVNLRTIDLGAGNTTIELRHLPSELPGSSPIPPVAPAVPVRPAMAPRSGLGPIPGQSAEAAAPAAMAQMREAAAMNPAVQGSHLPLPVAPAGVASGLAFALTPPKGPVAAGTTFVVPVVLNGATDIASVPMRIHYDPDKLSLVNVASGDFLGRDAQAVTLLHTEDPPGSLNLNAVRPPGAAGVSGSGSVYVLSFEAKAAGESTVAITASAVTNSAKQQIPAKPAQIDIQVR